MKQISRRTLALLLTAAMLCSLLVVPAAADEGADADVPVEETTAATVKGGDTISTGGVYQIEKDTTGTITINTTDPVTLTGGYALDETLEETEDSYKFGSLTIVSSGLTGGGAHIELENVGITGPAGNSILDFAGSGNTLTITGTNLLEYQPSYGTDGAAVHVGTGTELLINGSGTLYLYKSASGAGIGGKPSEMNGEVTFGDEDSSDLHIFAKGTKQSALIGAGANASSTSEAPGSITFENGVYNLETNSRGAAIGGSAGAGGGSTGTTVYVNNACVNINVDYSGSAVGGGGYEGGNDASGGTIYISGGSLRTYVDQNAASSTTGYGGVALTAGINDAAITARRLNDETDQKAVYKCVFDTSLLETSASDFTVQVDGADFYTGGLHEYCYINEALEKDEQISVTTTPSNWPRGDDTCLYLYLTGEDHVLTVNGEEFTANYDAEADAAVVCTAGPFTVEKAEEEAPDTAWDGVAVKEVVPEGDTYTVSGAAELAWVAAQVNAGLNDFSGKTVSIACDIDLNSREWTPIGSHSTPFAGTLDGGGHTVSGLSITESAAGYTGFVGENAGTLENFTLTGSMTASTAKNYIGAVSGYNTGTISGVTSGVTVALSGSNCDVGGITGFNEGTIYQCSNTADITAYKHLGGIAGTNYGVVDQCCNTGAISGQEGGKSAIGGIVGQSGDKSSKTSNSITNCYNTGALKNPGGRWYGGIAGFADYATTIANCYSIGAIASGYSWNWNPVVGHVDGVWDLVSNIYSLEGLNAGDSSAATQPITIGTVKTAEEMKSAEFAVQVSGDGRAFARDTGGINGGYPVLRWQTNDTSTCTGLTIESDPAKLQYVKGECFDADGLKIKASWSDGTSEYIQSYTISKTDAITEACTVTVAASYGGHTVSRDYHVTVKEVERIAITTPPTATQYVAGQSFDKSGMVVTVYYTDGSSETAAAYTVVPGAALTGEEKEVTITYTAPDGAQFTAVQAITFESKTVNSITVSTKPANLFYAADEAFDPTGMVVRAYYNDFPTKAVTLNAAAEDAPDGYICTVGEDQVTVTVSYTYAGKTVSDSFTITRSESKMPVLEDGAYQLSSAEDLKWFSNKVNTGATGINGTLTADVALPNDWVSIGTSAKAYAGIFDGNGKTLTFQMEAQNTSANFHGVFYYVSTGTVKNLTVDGSIKSTQSYVGGVVGSVSGAAVISGCTNKANVAGGNAAGGIIGNMGGKDAVITGNVNCGAVSGTANVGGIAGRIFSVPSRFAENLNTGSVGAAGASSVGGIVGNVGSAGAVVESCANTGSVLGKYSVGGIAGNIYKDDFLNCYNTGDITGSDDTVSIGSTTYGIGGIIGNHSNNADGSTMTNCYSTGTVVTNNASEKIFAGALVGRLEKRMTITNCYYLDGAAEQAYTELTEGLAATSGVSAKTAEELRAASMISLLNGESGSAFAADSTVIPINSGYPLLSWQAAGQPAVVTFSVTPDGASVMVEDAGGTAVAPEEDGSYRLTRGQLYYYTVTASGYASVRDQITPSGDCTVTVALHTTGGGGGGQSGTGNVKTSVWDGKSIDVSWYDPDETTYYISTPAQLAGLAAIVNGIYNPEIDTFAGNTSYIVDNRSYSADSGPNGMNQSTASYHYGADNFDGKTVYLTDDIDMSGGNYMPIGGQYLMTDEDTSTRIDASFCGVFDGDGHTVTIQCDRHCSGNYGDGQSIGLIGRLGVHDNDAAGLRPSGAAVRNVAVYGSVRGNRSVGGIVGKIGKTDGGALIESCANFAAVTGTDSKGTGGICGAAWNGGEIRNCYNAGTVTNSGKPTVGGIAGGNEIAIVNCYNVGQVNATGTTASLATDAGGSYENCYWLTGTAGVGVYNKTSDQIVEKTSDEMKSEAFLNALGAAFARDSRNINSGYPVLSWQNPGGQTGTGSGGTAVQPERPAVKLTPEAEIKNGAASAAVSEKELASALDAAADSGASAIVIVPEIKGTVDKVTVEVPVASAAALAQNGLSLRVETGAADVALSNAALGDVAAQSGKTAAVTVEKKEDGALSVTVAVDETPLASVSGGIKVAFDAAQGQVAVLVGSDGTETILPKSLVEQGKAYVLLPGSAVVRVVDRTRRFEDVAAGAWYESAVDFASSHMLFQGVSDTRFAPDGTMTRAMLVTVLHRLEGQPAAGSTSAFGDVLQGTWYTGAVDWASVNHIVSGTGAGFAPESSVTREQMASILYRYAQYLGMDLSAKGDLSRFSDGSVTSAWAEDAMAWAVGSGILAGRGNGTVDPQGTASRAEVASMLQRLVGLMVK